MSFRHDQKFFMINFNYLNIFSTLNEYYISVHVELFLVIHDIEKDDSLGRNWSIVQI